MSRIATSVAAVLKNAGLIDDGNGDSDTITAAPKATGNEANHYLMARYPELAEQFGCPLEMTLTKEGLFRPVNVSEDFLAAVIGREGPTKYVEDENRFYSYSPQSGIYTPTRREELAAKCSAVLYETVRACPATPGIEKLQFAFRKTSCLNGVLERAKGLLNVPSSFFDQEVETFMAVKNGVLQILDRTLLPFDPGYRLRRTLAVPYDKDARCPQFVEVLLRPAMTDEDIELLQRWFGLAILGKNRSQVILVFIGTAAGGKGVIARILNLLLGPSHVVSLRPRQLESRFEIGRMLGRSLVYGADVSSDFLNQPGAGTLKAITGGDPVTGELKGSNSRPEMTLTLNALITANVRLRFRLEGGEDPAAWRRRLRIIPFNNPPTPNPIHNLSERLFREEGPGILNWALDGLEKLRADGFNLRITPRQQNVVDDILRESDSVQHFIRDCLRRGDRLQRISVTECYDEYIQYCAVHGWTAIARRDFGGKLPAMVLNQPGLGMVARNDVKGLDGKQQHGFLGLICHRPRPAQS